MSNPFDALDISQDEQDQFVSNNKTDKVRKTHKERRQLKKQGTETTTPVVTSQGTNSDLPSRVRDNAKEVRHNRAGRPVKGVQQGHTLDRRSGTGRDDRPRKQGGGRGNVGNVQDQLHKEKYQKPVQEVVAQTEEAPVEQVKPEQLQKPTLAEYYQSKGVTLNTTATQKKAPVRGAVNADWLKKQKLTLVETKEDKKRQEVVKQNILQHNNTKVEMDLANSEFLGFGKKPVQKHHKEEEPKTRDQRGHKDGYKGAKKAPKVVLKEDDFPAL